VKKNAHLRRASNVAGKSNKNAKPKSASDYCKLTRAAIEFQILTLQSELKVLDELMEMSDDEKMTTLFELLDKDGDRKIDAVELADGLRKVRGDVAFEEGLILAIDRVANFDKDGDAKLDRKEFENLIMTILEAVGCTFSELSELLVMQVLFSPTGNTMMENIAGEIISEDVDDAVKEEEELLHALADERMEALFALFDIDNDGSIDFKEVVLGMYKLTDDIDGASKAAVSAILLFDENNSKSLDYEEFTKLMINVAATSSMTFDDIADSLTRLAAQPVAMSDEDISSLFAMDQTLNRLKDIQKSDSNESITIDALELAKIDRLFELFDLDENGSIDFHELALGLRKFQEATKMEETVEQCIKAFDAFDTNSDEKLDRDEFPRFIAQFARMACSDLSELIDFMIVTSALKENKESEEKYIKSIGASDLYYWGY